MFKNILVSFVILSFLVRENMLLVVLFLVERIILVLGFGQDMAQFGSRFYF